MPPTVVTRTLFELEGAAIVGDVARSDDASTPVMYIPGWACTRGHLLDLARETSTGAFAVIDLPGQGESVIDDDVSIARFAGWVAETIDQLGWPRVALVGHSMGGAVAVEVARRIGDRADRIVGLDSLTYATLYPKQDELAIRATIEPFERDFRGTMRELVTALFLPASAQEVIELVIADMSSAPEQNALRSLSALLRWDRDEALRATTCPIEIVSASAFLDETAADALRRRARITEVDFGGHFFFMEDRDATARLLRDALSRGSS